MRRVVAVLVVLLLAACGPGLTPAAPEGDSDGETDRTVAIYSAIVRRLSTVDHTFAKKGTPFRVIFIVDHPIEGAGAPMSGMARGSRRAAFTEEIKQGIEANLGDLPPIHFVAGRDEVMDPRSNFPRVRDGGAVVTLAPIPDGENAVKVGAGLYFSALGGVWLTYVVERSGERWKIKRSTGPISIS